MRAFSNKLSSNVEASNKYYLIFNFIAFDICWALLVLFDIRIAALSVAAFLLIHLVVHRQHLLIEVAALTATLVVGSSVDLFMFLTGFYNSDSVYVLPAWLLLLWLNFALLLREGLKFLYDSMFMAILLGAVLGPFSYWLGLSLRSDISLAVSPQYYLIVMALVWSLLFLALLKINQCFKPRLAQP